MFWVLGLSLALAPEARASFIGYYSVANWTLTNTDNGGAPSFTNGSVVEGPGGSFLTLTGGSSGSAWPGTTDFVIRAIGTGLVQFQYSYYSADVPSPINPGCGPFLTDPCDLAGFLLNGQFSLLADDVNQSSGVASFSVSDGDLFGFRVDTLDNIGEAGALTVSNFSAPTPEPGTAVLIPIAAAVLAAARMRFRRR
jgi:hypothetical protein